MADIFVSYSRQDKARVAPLVARARGRGLVRLVGPGDHPGRGIRLADLARARAGPRRSSWSGRRTRSTRAGCAARPATPPIAACWCRCASTTRRLPIDFRAVHTTDLDGWAEDSSSPALRSRCARRSRPSSGAAKPKAATWPPTARPGVSVCVLPFVNMSGDPEQEYFSDGITEDIITDLSKVSALFGGRAQHGVHVQGQERRRGAGRAAAQGHATCWKAACARPASACASRRS